MRSDRQSVPLPPPSTQDGTQTPLVIERPASRPLLNTYRSEVKRAILMQLSKNPSASDIEICRGIDAEGSVDIPKGWTSKPGNRSFELAYKDSSTRSKIEKTISKVRADLREQGLLSRR